MFRKRLAIFIAVIMAASCDFLKEDQTTSLSEGLYDTERMLETHINGIIGRFITQSSFTGEASEYLAISSGILHHGLNASTATSRTYYASTFKLTQYASSSKNSSLFSVSYGIVNACNVLLHNLIDSPVDPAYKAEIEAEAKFYRAYMMFRIVKVYGNCPIKTTSSNLGNLDEKRDPWFEVYKQIISDLKDAELNMRSPERVDQVTPKSSRVNKYAATALLSSVYVTIGSLMTDLTTNFWDETDSESKPDFESIGIKSSEDAYRLALASAEKLIPESGKADPNSPYRLVEHFGDLFNWDPAFSRNGISAYDNPERIFVLPITSTCNSYIARYSLPPYPEGTIYTGALTTSNNGRWRPSRWVFQKWCETYPGERVLNETNDYYLNSSDPRLALTMYYDTLYNESTKSSSSIYPRVFTVKEGTNINIKVAFPYFRKHWSRNYRHDGGEADYHLIRLAEVYLNAAEAAAELGEKTKACNYIECLHARARKSVPEGMPDSEMPKWNSQPTDLRVAIFWERMFEQLGEGHEYDNVHRWGATWMSENITKVKNNFNKRVEQEAFWWGGYIYPHDKKTREPYEYPEDPQTLRKSLLYAYPVSELNYNNSLTPDDQNPFWWGI